MDMTRFKKARDKGCAYLLEKQHADGSFGSPDLGVTDYYKVPLAFQVCGQTRAANRLCDWIRRNGTMPNGDFGPRPNEAINDYFYSYYNSWVVIGAHRLGQFDLSLMGMEFLMNFWDSENGGFYSSPTERNAETMEDLWVVSGCGQAALYTGRIDVARGVGRWMELLMVLQPNYPQQFYPVYSRAQGLHTVSDGNDFRYVLNQDATRDESFYHPGIAGGFLARLYQATGEQEWLGLAKEYMRFAENASAHLFSILRAGKVGWAASVLYTLTGQQKYNDMAVRVGDNLINIQASEGYWCNVDEDSPSNDMTAEMVVWLDEIHQAVGIE